ncbi:MAG: ribulose-phosphate 3-epimerase [Candidatus Cloacimonetes bacterium]|nr:ribulose-phosphate 3-epimerase [Candidatus Cloacimonadota bacterium]
MVKIAPSILSADFVRLENEINKVQKAGADILHLDVMDGHFVPNLTFGLPIIKSIKDHASIPIDVHLMVTNPENFLKELCEWKIDYVSFHQEVNSKEPKHIKLLKENGVKAGLAINPATPVESIFPLISLLDFVLIMSVNPGFGGQSFMPIVYEKIKTLKIFAAKINPSLEIEVDGGINDKTAPKLISIGADILVAGSYIFADDDYKTKIQLLRNSKSCSTI